MNIKVSGPHEGRDRLMQQKLLARKQRTAAKGEWVASPSHWHLQSTTHLLPELCYKRKQSQQNNALEEALEQPRDCLGNYLFTRRWLVEPSFNSSLHLSFRPLESVHWTQDFTHHLFQQPLLALQVVLGAVKPPLTAAHPAPEVL